MADDKRISNQGGIGGVGTGLTDSEGPGQGAPTGADDRYPVGMGDDDRGHSGERAGGGTGGGGSGLTTEREDGRDDDVVNAGETAGIDNPAEQGRETDGPMDRYDPDPVEVNRARQQGLGVGAADLARQGDPGGEG